MSSTSPLAVDAVTQRVTFLDKFALSIDKIATCLLLPPAFFLSPPTFWEARDQPEPGSFFPRMKDPGNEVASKGD